MLLRDFLPSATPDFSPGAAARWPAALSSACGASEGDPPYRETRSLFAYTGDVRTAILSSKYTGRPFPARATAQRLQEALQGPWKDLFSDGLAPVIVPIPIHPVKYFRRGFNLPALIGVELARLMAWPYDPVALHRRPERLPQASLPLKDREANIKDAFFVPEGKNAAPRVLLLDDVLTTGATCAAAATALKRAGVKHITVVTIASAFP